MLNFALTRLCGESCCCLMQDDIPVHLSVGANDGSRPNASVDGGNPHSDCLDGSAMGGAEIQLQSTLDSFMAMPISPSTFSLPVI